MFFTKYVQCTLYTVQCTVYTVHIVHCTVHTKYDVGSGFKSTDRFIC